MSKKHRYTAEQIEYIRKIAPNRAKSQIRDMVNDKYGINITSGSIRGIMYRHKIKNRMQGYNSRFEKGYEPWNKGMKGLQTGGEEGWFKKGHTDTRAEIGTEHMKDGRVMIKVSQPNVWVEKHRWLWEKHHGKIPKRTAISFKDGNKKNVTIENLFSTTISASAAVARRKLPEHHPELKVSSHRLAELKIAINKINL